MWPIWGALITAGLTAIVFIIVERRTSSPMLPLELFSSSTFSAANVVGLLLNFGFYGQLFFINLFFQQIRGYSPLLAGLALLPETVSSGWPTGFPGVSPLTRGRAFQ